MNTQPPLDRHTIVTHKASSPSPGSFLCSFSVFPTGFCTSPSSATTGTDRVLPLWSRQNRSYQVCFTSREAQTQNAYDFHNSQSPNEPWPLVSHFSLPYHINHILKGTAATAPLRDAGSATGLRGTSQLVYNMVRTTVRTTLR